MAKTGTIAGDLEHRTGPVKSNLSIASGQRFKFGPDYLLRLVVNHVHCSTLKVAIGIFCLKIYLDWFILTCYLG